VFTNEHTLEDSYSIAYDDTIPLVYDDDEYDIFSPPTIEEKISYDYNMPPIFDDYGDENNNDSYFVEFSPTTINKNDYVYVGVLILLCMWLMIRMFYVIAILLIFMMLLKVIMREGSMVLCISTNIKFPLFMLKTLKLHLFCFPMLVALRFLDLFLYKILFYRKWFRLKSVSYLIFDALFCFKLFYGAYVSIFSNFYA
jgi:hypothetical protein